MNRFMMVSECQLLLGGLPLKNDLESGHMKTWVSIPTRLYELGLYLACKFSEIEQKNFYTDQRDEFQD